MMFKTRGPITKDDDSPYIYRPADHDLRQLIQQIDYVALIGTKYSGKTSMLMHLWESLAELPRYVLTYVNLSVYMTLDEERWYQEVYKAIVASSGDELPPPNDPLEDAIDFREAILTALRNDIPNQILIVLMDDVESVPHELRTPFFATLREMFVSRGIEPALRRLSFVLSGSYIPDDLIPDASISPFRIAEKLYLQDAEDVSPLVESLENEGRTLTENGLQKIYEWAEGDLYLTQRICAKLDSHYRNGKITSEAVNQVVHRYVMEDDLFISLGKHLHATTAIAELTADIHGGQTIRFTRTNRALAELWLLGLIKENAYGNCIIRNPVYIGVLDTLLSSQPKPITKPLKPHIPQDDTGTQVLKSRYAIESLLQRGPLNHIYRGIDEQSGDFVAIKELNAFHQGDPITWRRFQREAEVLQQLDHPNIVKIFDSFQEADQNYIVMEYIDGGTTEILMNREGRQSVDSITRLILDISSALGYAHANGIVHRDIKPSNILLTQDFVPKLADFGVAHFMANNERITQTYAVVGTPAYLCPEGYDTSVFAPTEDIWSLGVTFFELLTGTLPFTGRTQEHVRFAVLNAPIPDIRTIRPDIPAELAHLIRQMMERDPAKRLPDGQAVYDQLREVILAIR